MGLEEEIESVEIAYAYGTPMLNGSGPPRSRAARCRSRLATAEVANATQAEIREPLASRSPETDLEREGREIEEELARSFQAEVEFEGLARRATRLRAEWDQADAAARDADGSLVVERMRLGGRIKKYQDILKPMHKEKTWTTWLEGVCLRLRASEKKLLEAVQLWNLAEGQEERVRGLSIRNALKVLKAARDAVKPRKATKAPKPEDATRPEGQQRQEEAEGQEGGLADFAPRRPDLDEMEKPTVSPGLARLREAFRWSTEADRQAFYKEKGLKEVNP